MPLFKSGSVKYRKHKRCRCGGKRAYSKKEGIEACAYLMTTKTKFKVKYSGENEMRPVILEDENGIEHTGAEILV